MKKKRGQPKGNKNKPKDYISQAKSLADNISRENPLLKSIPQYEGSDKYEEGYKNGFDSGYKTALKDIILMVARY